MSATDTPTTITPDRAKLLPLIHLASGSHDTPEDGVCLLEAAAYLAGEPHSDHPCCVSPVLGAAGRALNDVLPDARRQALTLLLPSIIGTAGDGHDQARGLMAADWLIRTYTPTWLRLADLDQHAATLENLPPITTWDQVETATHALRAAVAAARDAAGAAARAAAGAAARDAAWAALQPTVDLLQDSAIDLYRRMTYAGGVA